MSSLKDAIEDLFDPRLVAAEAVERHFAPGFHQRTNGGDWDDRAALLARIVAGREVVEHVSVTVLDELSQGDRYAERHVIDLTQRDGAHVVQEVYVFAVRDPDGRFARIHETTLTVKAETERSAPTTIPDDGQEGSSSAPLVEAPGGLGC